MNPKLLQALAKMLPETLVWRNGYLGYKTDNIYKRDVYDTELLSLCWLVEESLTDSMRDIYLDDLYEICNSDSIIQDAWNMNHSASEQRITALAKVKGIEIQEQSK